MGKSESEIERTRRRRERKKDKDECLGNEIVAIKCSKVGWNH